MTIPFLDPERAERVRKHVRELQRDHANSAITLIGGTPIVELTRIYRHDRVRLFAKLEGLNPAGSSKDRLALYLVADAIDRGVVGPGNTLVEASAGNTGIALAMICARLEQRLIITLAADVSLERKKLIKAYGAEIVLTPGPLGTCGAIEKARELAQLPNHYWVAQHFNTVNSFAHYETTGVEIPKQLGALTDQPLDAFVAASGTTGTLMGISQRLKERVPGVEIVAVWPKDAIIGIRRPEGDKRPGIYDDALIDRVVDVHSTEATAMQQRLAKTEGLFVGPSGSAAIVGAIDTARRLEDRGGLVLVLLPDFGERYLSLDTSTFQA